MARRTVLVFCGLFLLWAGWAAAQPEVQQLMTLWQNEQWDKLQTSLPAAAAKYPDHPNTLFFSALFERDGDAAYQKYKAGWKGLPAELMDDALMRLAQYQQARGNSTAPVRPTRPWRSGFPPARWPMTRATRAVSACWQRAKPIRRKVV